MAETSDAGSTDLSKISVSDTSREKSNDRTMLNGEKVVHLLPDDVEDDSEAALETSKRVEDDDAFAPAETKAVFWLKLVVIVVLIASAVIIGVTVFFYTSKSEKDQFEEGFKDSSEKVVDAISRSFDSTLGAADSFIVGLVSFARFSGMEWPYVTLPDYAVRLSKVRALSNAVVVATYHLVQDKQRELWQNYSLANDAWVGQALEVQKNDRNFHGMLFTEFEPNGVIHTSKSRDGSNLGPGPFFPKWQNAPIVPNFAPYNWDANGYSSLAEALPELIQNKRVVISEVSNLLDSKDQQAVDEAAQNINWIEGFISIEDDPAEPMSDILYPILDNAPDSVTLGTSNGTAVGVLGATFFWRDLIRDILPSGTDGIICVIGNGCNQVFTYQIDGPHAIYLGPGDLHDTAYDYMGQTGSLNTGLDTLYTGVPLSEGPCPYWLKVYPSKVSSGIFTFRW